MTIKIEVKKFVNGKGIKVASIVSITGMKTKDELPTEYTTHEPCTWIVDGKIEHTQGCRSMYIGYEYSYDDIITMLDQIKKCGQHLHDVNIQVKKDIAEWTKNETFII